MKKIMIAAIAATTLFMASCHDHIEVTHQYGKHIVQVYENDCRIQTTYCTPDSSCIECRQVGYFGAKASVIALRKK